METVFQKPGRFYRGNLHTHSTRSDGAWTPEQVIEGYRSRGYDFIALTDHFLPETHFRKDAPPESFITVSDTTHLRTGDFTTLLGAEIHGPALTTGDAWHFVAAGLPLDFAPLGPNETGPEIAQRAFEAGAFVGFAHPAWYALTLDDALPSVPHCHAIEIFNTGCTLRDRPESWHFADAIYGRGYRLTGFAADDAHFRDPRGETRDAFGGWVQVKADALDSDALVASLKRGDYYSSTGPTIEDIRLTDEALTIRTSPCIHYVLNGSGARYGNHVGEAITEHTFPRLLDNGAPAGWATSGYVRVTVIDAEGNKAWSNPLWFE